MNPPPSTPVHTTESLLAQASWVRALAARLVADPHLAEDVVQEALSTALERPPAGGRPLRAWLGSVVKNLARQSRRSESRRRTREAAAARREEEPSTLEALERLSIHRELVDEVTELEEPYRTAILLRYFDGLPPREIAELQGLPVKTVKTRLARGLERLRARLAARHQAEGPHRWLGALAPLLRAPGAGARPEALLPSMTLGALTVNAQIKLTLATLAIGGALAGLWWIRQEPTGSPGSPEAAANDEVADLTPIPAAPALARDADAALQRRAVQAARPEAEPSLAAVPEPAREMHTLRVRVLDTGANPVAGVRLELAIGRAGELAEILDAAGVPVRSAGDGWVGFPAPEGVAEIRAAGEDWLTVLAGVHRPGSEIEPVVVVARPVTYGGRVVDDFGRPVEGAQLRIARPEDFDARFGAALEGSQARGWAATTDAAGRFAFEPAPLILDARLRASRDGFQGASVDAPVQPTDGLQLTLTRHRARDGNLAGRVIDPSGAPVAGARVAMGAFSTLTDDDGGFGVDLGLAVGTGKLVAIKEGFLPAFLEEPAVLAGETTGWPEYVELELGGAPLALRGRVLDEDGAPIVRARVWLADPTAFGLINGRPVQVENLLAGAAVPRGQRPQEELSEMIRRGGRMQMMTDAESPDAVWSWVETDTHGEFDLVGLTGRPYRVTALDQDTLLQATAGPFDAGSRGIEIVLPRDGLYERVSGQVKDRAGSPLEGVRVSVNAEPFRTETRIASATFSTGFIQPGPTTVTDEEGRFTFEQVPREGVTFSFMGDAIMPTRFVPDEDTDVRAIEVVAETKCHFEVLLEDDLEGEARISFADGEGGMVLIYLIRGGQIQATTSFPLVDGRSGVIAVSGLARTLRLTLDGEVLQEVEVTPVPGEVTEVRL